MRTEKKSIHKFIFMISKYHNIADVLDWSKKLDVWSFGITLWEILERKRPFEGLDEVSIQSMWLNSPYQARLPSLKIPDQGSPQKLRVMRSLSDLIDDCTRLDPNSRPTFHDILKRVRQMMPSTGSMAQEVRITSDPTE